MVIEPEVSELVEDTYSDVRLNLTKYKTYLNEATPIVGEDFQENILAVNS